MATTASEPPKSTTTATATKPVVGYPVPNTDAPPPLSAPVPAYPAERHFDRNPYYTPFRGGYNEHRAPSSHDAIIRWIIFSFIVAFIIVTIALLWFTLGIRDPNFSVSSATVSSFNLFSPSDADLRMSSSFDIALSISNPNKKNKIWYGTLAVAVAYGDYILAETTLSPFHQENENFTTLRATLVAAGDYVGTDVAKGMSDDRASGDSMVLQVTVEAWIWIEMRQNSWTMMKVYCGDIRIAFANKTASSGSMVGPVKKCQVKL